MRRFLCLFAIMLCIWIDLKYGKIGATVGVLILFADLLFSSIEVNRLREIKKDINTITLNPSGN